MNDYRQKIGRIGEELALKYYAEHGYGVIDKNWRRKFAEIDLIVGNGQEIIFVEVKTRRSKNYGWGELAVGFRKKQKIKHAIDLFLLENEIYKEMNIRFDVLVVELGTDNIPKYTNYEAVEL